MQLQTDIKNRQGSETSVDLKERETKRGILGTFGKTIHDRIIHQVEFRWVETDEQSNLVVRRAELNAGNFASLSLCEKNCSLPMQL